jgi:hypothetical protein
MEIKEGTGIFKRKFDDLVSRVFNPVELAVRTHWDPENSVKYTNADQHGYFLEEVPTKHFFDLIECQGDTRVSIHVDPKTAQEDEYGNKFIYSSIGFNDLKISVKNSKYFDVAKKFGEEYESIFGRGVTIIKEF